MKKYLKSLFPWRWIIVMLFILTMSIIIAMGHMVESTYPSDVEFFRPYTVLWYVCNFFFWFLIDYTFGLGRKGLVFPEIIITKEIELPKGFMNVGISSDTENPVLTANTNDSTNWDEIKIPLPSGKWSIKTYKEDNKIVVIKKVL